MTMMPRWASKGKRGFCFTVCFLAGAMSAGYRSDATTTQAFLQSTLPASTVFELWLPMDSENLTKGNCNASSSR